MPPFTAQHRLANDNLFKSVREQWDDEGLGREKGGDKLNLDEKNKFMILFDTIRDFPCPLSPHMTNSLICKHLQKMGHAESRHVLELDDPCYYIAVYKWKAHGGAFPRIKTRSAKRKLADKNDRTKYKKRRLVREDDEDRRVISSQDLKAYENRVDVYRKKHPGYDLQRLQRYQSERHEMLISEAEETFAWIGNSFTTGFSVSSGSCISLSSSSSFISSSASSDESFKFSHNKPTFINVDRETMIMIGCMLTNQDILQLTSVCRQMRDDLMDTRAKHLQLCKRRMDFYYKIKGTRARLPLSTKTSRLIMLGLIHEHERLSYVTDNNSLSQLLRPQYRGPPPYHKPAHIRDSIRAVVNSQYPIKRLEEMFVLFRMR